MAIAADPFEKPGEDEVDESELIGRAQAGDRKAFERLYTENVSRIYALCWRLCAGNEAMAGDMTQEAFIRAWDKLGSFRGDAAFGTWMHRLTVNLVIGEKRKQLRRNEMERPMEEGIARRLAGSNPVMGTDRDLEEAIARLPERARTVLVLHDVEGYMHHEIAEMADMAVGTSKAQLHRARTLLREWLEQ